MALQEVSELVQAPSGLFQQCFSPFDDTGAALIQMYVLRIMCGHSGTD